MRECAVQPVKAVGQAVQGSPYWAMWFGLLLSYVQWGAVEAF